MGWVLLLLLLLRIEGAGRERKVVGLRLRSVASCEREDFMLVDVGSL